MLKPRRLESGSKIVVVSPSGPVWPVHLESGLGQLRGWGFEVEVPDAVYGRCERPRGYLAGEDCARLGALNAALASEAEAVVFARGGYGAMRLLPGIDWSALIARPKVLMGFSDITALLLAAWAEVGLVSLHGPVIKSFGLYPMQDDPSQTLEQTRRALCGERGGAWRIEGLSRVAGEGCVRGQLIGGNLSLMASLLGTRWAAQCGGKIVFLEEVGEQDYRVDRLLRQLMWSWQEGPPAAVVLGDFMGMAGVYAGEGEVEELLCALGAELGVPVARGLPCGHGARNVPLPIGVEAALDVDAGVLTVYGDCVHG
jgi:muramoyltetrapeptide carboxypeptidase